MIHLGGGITSNYAKQMYVQESNEEKYNVARFYQTPEFEILYSNEILSICFVAAIC